MGLEEYEEQVCDEQNNSARHAKSTSSREQTERPWHEERVAVGGLCRAQQTRSTGATKTLLCEPELTRVLRLHLVESCCRFRLFRDMALENRQSCSASIPMTDDPQIKVIDTDWASRGEAPRNLAQERRCFSSRELQKPESRFLNALRSGVSSSPNPSVWICKICGFFDRRLAQAPPQSSTVKGKASFNE